LANGDEAEKEHAAGEPNTGTEFLHENVGGDLEHYVWDEEHGESGVVFYILEVKICG